MSRLGFGVYVQSDREVCEDWAGKAEADSRDAQAVRDEKRKGFGAKNRVGVVFGKRKA